MVKEMSDPITNAEIEDVLSSIRRLVTEEARKPDVVVPSAADNVADDDSTTSDKLVLKPSQRIPDEPEPESVEDEPPLVLGTARGEFTVVGGSDVDGPDTDDADVTLHPVTPVEDDNFEDDQSAIGDTTHDEIDETEGEFNTALSAKIEALETAIAETRDQWEAEPSKSDSYSGETPEAETIDDLAEAFAAQADPVSPQIEPETPQDAAAPETESKEPEVMAWTDVQDDIDPKVVIDMPDDTDTDFLADVDSAQEEDLIDEETLREMVAQIVREELQGALGEKITRNMRKLVRREIHRALISRDLE